MGYKRFRTFYDGVGGFFPETDRLYRLVGEQLHVDRGSFWVGAKYAKPDQPVFTFSYHDDVRTGIQGLDRVGAGRSTRCVTVVKNALVGNALPANAVYINPNTQILDEHHRSVDAGVTAKIGRTTETFKFTVRLGQQRRLPRLHQVPELPRSPRRPDGRGHGRPGEPDLRSDAPP